MRDFEQESREISDETIEDEIKTIDNVILKTITINKNIIF